MLGSLTMISAIQSYVIAIIVAIPALGVGVIAGIYVYRHILKKKKLDADTEFTRIIDDARAEAKTIRKDALLEIKEEKIKLHSEFEKESKERRAEIQKHEFRVSQKENIIDKKETTLERKLEQVDRFAKELDAREIRVKNLEQEFEKHAEQVRAEIERISGLTAEEAKQIIIQEMQDEARKEAVNIIREIEKDAREEGDKRAQNIVALAIQRCAVDQSAEATISVVELPSEDMKGRIIGRVGRNIKAFESVTGVDVIIDDTPDVVTLTGFDPVRREVARLTLLKLVADGRIHPGRIEEIADRVRRDMDATIKEAGENAVYDAGLNGIHLELIKLIGRLKFRTSYGQNVLKHSIEVSHLAGLLAAELGADIKIAKRAGLLHDIGKAVDHEYEGTHVQIGVELAKKYRESDKVIHAIAAHHNDIEPTTVEAIIVQAADTISGARPGARRESIEYYVKRLEKLENLANSFAGVEQSFAIQAGREIRVIVRPDQVDDAGATILAKDIAKKLESELEYPGQIKVNVIRETRSVEFAK
ncbi:MAG: ribonuclease Y [Christensenellaceae bacterium]|nr:ribonuclease Y [Christensenellaceae bacterium]